MKHLSGLDASFLHFESPQTPMHVGSLTIFDLPDDYEGDFYDNAVREMSRRLHLAPVFERKLALMPLELANPMWVHDDEVDLEYHIRRIVLPKPGTLAQLEAYVGRLHSNLLDRSRPLWEIYVFEGLKTDQVALYSKFHHAGMDGAAGMEVAAAMLDISPEPREDLPPPDPRPHRLTRPPLATLARAAAGNIASQYINLVKLLPNAAFTIAKNVIPSGVPKLPRGWELAPKTPFNVALTSQRTFASKKISLATVKKVAKKTECTINDVVMALCSSALRGYLAEVEDVPKKSLIAVVPVSLREAGNKDQNNQITLTLASLASNVSDPVSRLRAIQASCSTAKKRTARMKAAIPLDFPSFGAPWLMGGLATLYGLPGLTSAIPTIANVVISNVPGPQFPLYFAGARMRGIYPVSIPYHGLGLNITVQSYDGALDFGLTACRKALPDVRRLADMLAEALDDLASRVLEPEPIKAAEPTVGKKKAATKSKKVAGASAPAKETKSKPRARAKSKSAG